MDIWIRQIRPDDAAALADFYNGLSAASIRTFRPIGTKATLEACTQIIEHNSPEIANRFDLVACDGPKIVGWGFLCDLHTDKPTLGLGVADECQGQRLGRALMDAVLAYAVQQGIPEVGLTVVCDNEKAQQMYERRGFVKTDRFIGDDGLSYYRMAADLSACSDRNQSA